MKKIKLSILLLTLSIFSLTGCGSNDVEKVDLKNLVDDYVRKESILKENDNYFNPNEYSLLGDDISGIVSISMYDFDSDKEDEVIISRVNNNNINLTLYELEKDKLVEKDNYTLLNDQYKYADIINMNSFVKIINNKPYLFYESVLYSSLVADGVTWEFSKLSVNNGKFTVMANDHFSGSYFDEDFINSKLQFVRNTSLVIKSFWFYDNGKSLYEQNKDNAYLMYEINRNHLDNFNLDDYYSSKESKILYGKTTYKDLSNNYKIGV